MTDLGSSPDLRDVQRVGRAFLRSQPSPDLPAIQRLVSEAFVQPKAFSFPNLFNK